VLFDRGYLPTAEPFQRLINQGMILGEMEYHGFETEDGRPVSADRAVKLEVGWVEEVATIRELPNGTQSTFMAPKQPIVKLREVSLNEDDIEQRGAKAVRKGSDNVYVLPRSYKMSKSRGNVINPDDVVNDYGADSLRLYEMFMGPLEAMKPWSMRSVGGVHKFLSRVWRLIVDEAAETPTRNASVQDTEPDKETLKLLHKTIKKVTEDTEGLRFNTAIAAMMEFSNYLTSKVEVRPVKVLEPFVLLLAPYAPHVAEELWQVLGHSKSLAYEPWPAFDPALGRDDEIEIPVQINGKVKARLMVPADADAATLEKLALADPKVQEQLAGKTVRKVIAKPRQMVSIVVS
jgi:leucyl-tRNA synthetase